jgi:hypothetical protein
MKKIALVVMMAMMVQTVQSNFITRLSRVSNVLQYITAAREIGTVLWVADIDGMLIGMLPEPYKLMEKDTVDIFKKARKEATIVGLASTEQIYMYSVLTGLNNLGIDFPRGYFSERSRIPLEPQVDPELNVEIRTMLYNNIIFTQNPKGQALTSYLLWRSNQGYELPDTIIFSDDKKKNVESVLDSVELFGDINFIGLHYVPDESEQ